MIRVVVADDHPVVRAGYRRLLDDSGGIRVVAEAADGHAAYAACVAEAPDVVVTDLSMPAGGGELIRRLVQRVRGLRVLVFSMHDSALVVRQAFEAGASGYLTKASPPDCVVDAVHALARGQRYLAPELPPAWLHRGPHDEGERLASLSAREFEVFRLLAQGRSAAECAQLLNLSAKTVSNHQSTIKDKLQVETSAALAHLAIRHRVIVPAAL